MLERFQSILAQFPSKKVLVLGDFCLDEYIYGETDELSPEFPVLRLFVHEKKYSPGAAGNVVAGVRALGAETFAVGVIGNDINGSILLGELQNRGITTDGLVRVNKRNTPTYSRIVCGGKRRPKQHVARFDVENDGGVDPVVRAQVVEYLRYKIPTVDAIIIADYEEVDGAGIVVPELIEIISALGRQYNKKTFAVSRKRIGLFKGFTAIVPNDLEAWKAGNIDARTEEEFRVLAELLKEKLHLDATVITRGADGISVWYNNEWVTHPSLATNVVDVCGAGDTVTSMITLSTVAGASFSDAALLGNVAASITVSREGTVSVTRDDVLAVLQAGLKKQESKKLRTREEMRKVARDLRANNKRIAFLNGYFDPIHTGHIELVNRAKQHGDVLIIGLNSDSSVRDNKGPERPFMKQEKRAQLLGSMEAVDYVVIFDELTPIRLIQEIQPYIIAKGNNYRAEEVVGKEIVESYGGKVVLIDMIHGLTSEGVLESIKGRKENLKKSIIKTLEKQQGILFAEPAIVHRCQYSGRDIIAQNSKFEEGYVDHRGYVPVEWWIMSKTPAENDKPKENEGLSSVYLETELRQETILFKDAVDIAKEKLLGTFADAWPLTKILDIGGAPVRTSFGTEEVPPIPCHIHSGNIVNGKAVGPGKLEAYFFPPTHVPPYNKHFGKTITRLGLKPTVTKHDVVEKLRHFGIDDSMYELCSVYEVNAHDGWTILPGVVHAPGPWTTFEIQRPQDDFNLASWQLGKRFSGEELAMQKKSLQLRGLADEQTFVDEVINWDVSTDPHFKDNWYRPSRVLQQGPWGRQLQIFFDAFYGEAFEINPGCTWVRNADSRPFAGIVWSGQGTLNGNIISVANNNRKEFLVTPNTTVTIKNTGETPLLIYTVFPILN